MKKTVRLLIVALFSFSSIFINNKVSAGNMPFMPEPGKLVSTTDVFAPATLKGIKFIPDNPEQLSFLIDAGDFLPRGSALQNESINLVRYFLAALTVPPDEQWVNLSPQQPERIMSGNFEKTSLGRDLLAQDYLLKQLTASLTYPDNPLGAAFWGRIYKKVHRELGVTDIPAGLLNKIWIVPEKAIVYQNGEMAYVVDAHLQVMTEAEYFSRDQKNRSALSWREPGISDQESLAADNEALIRSCLKEIIIPEIEKEVNEGKNFYALRQMYNAVILATWFKRNLRESFLGSRYADQNKLIGIDLKDGLASKENIYHQYVDAYKKGTYDIIKEDYDESHQEIFPRRYIAGGLNLGRDTDEAMTVRDVSKANLLRGLIDSDISALYEAKINLKFQQKVDSREVLGNDDDRAMLTNAQIPPPYKNQIIKSGAEAVFRLAVDPEQNPAVTMQSLRLVTNMGGVWQIYDGAIELVTIDDQGHSIFEARTTINVNRNHSIAYTFFNINEETGQKEWVNAPGDDGKVTVIAPFNGRIATISMEFGGPLGQKAGGQGDVIYGKNTEVAEKSDPEKAPISIIPYFKANVSDSIVEKYDRFEWETVENFEYVFNFNRKGRVKITADRAVIEGVEVYRLNSDDERFFQRLYSDPETEFYESILLSRGGVVLLKHLMENAGVKIDVVESNDHHTGLVIPLMRGEYSETFDDVGHVMLLHNISYQGQYADVGWVDEMGLPVEYRQLVQAWNQINMLAIPAKMLSAENRVVTVSPRYVLETLSTFSSLGFLVDRLLAQNPEYFIGLLNGLSESWNPETDKVLQRHANAGFINYNLNTRDRKRINKKSFQALFARDADNPYKKGSAGYLVEGSDNMLLVSTNRLQSQKQLDIIKYQIQRAQHERRGIDFVVIGDGIYEQEMRTLAQEVSQDPQSTVRFVYRPFNGDLERLALAAADGCIAPSDFEPGGLSHLKGMLYGAVPFVRWTGGLADTVEEGGAHPSGFGFAGVSRTFAEKQESPQVKGILSYVNWQEFIYEVDQELAKVEVSRGKFEASDIDLFEAIGRAFQKDGVLNIENPEDKHRLFWDVAKGISNGWAITNVDTVRKAVNERQFYRAILRGLDMYEKDRNYFETVISANAMKIEAYWSSKIDSYFQLYEEMKELVNPDEKTLVEARFRTGDFKDVKLNNVEDRMKIAEIRNTQKIDEPSILDTSVDSAMVSSSEVGGIDFNTEYMQMELEGQDLDFPSRYTGRDLENLPFLGLLPEIIEFSPVINLSSYLDTPEISAGIDPD